MPQSFVGRQDKLARLCSAISGSRPVVVVVYGRRRIGKSELIRKSLEGRKYLVIEGLENRPKAEQISGFLLQLKHQTKSVGLERAVPPKTWRETFLLLYEAIKDDPRHIFLDEFQWLANYRSEIVADLKMVWDQYLSHLPGVSLILCGSIASFMVKRVIRSSALYGRTDLEIHLRAFDIGETAQMLADRGISEIIEAHLLTGGVPKYVSLLSDASSIRIGMQDRAFTENGYFVTEFDRIFLSHFGRNPKYREILVTLAKHPYGQFRKQIAQAIGASEGGVLSQLLDNLEAAGFITSQTPLDRPAASKIKRYILTDAYLRFYLAFILPDLARIKSGASPNIFHQLAQTGAFHAWMGKSFEFLCLQHAATIAQLLGFSGVNYTCGPFFLAHSSDREGVQADLLFDRADNVVTICEMKYSLAAPGTELVQEVESRVEKLQPHFAKKTFQRVLVTLTPPSRELTASGYFYRILPAEDLFHR